MKKKEGTALGLLAVGGTMVTMQELCGPSSSSSSIRTAVLIQLQRTMTPSTSGT